VGQFRIVLSAFLAAATAVVLQGQAAAPSADALAARVHARYATIRDFTADFTLTTTSGLSLGGGADRGKVIVKKPVRMRWTLETGSRHEVISDGTTLFNYFPKDKVVNVAALNDQTSTALLLLTGRGDITRDFTARMAPNQPPTEWRLTLTPRTPQPDYKEITLAVDRTTLRLVGLDILDDQGTVRAFRFSNLRENQGVADSGFTFRIPPGVEVQR
jgi:outer membrane lipoprotein carrier protein